MVMFRRWLLLLLVLALVLALAACSDRGSRNTAAATTSPLAAVASGASQGDSEPPASLAKWDAKRGQELVIRHECQRCHEGTGVAAVPREAHCTSCHQDILAGTFPAAKHKLAKWRDHVGYVRRVPSLVGAGRLKPQFIADFLLNPHDQRPALAPTMPRLALSATDARDIAMYLVSVGNDAAFRASAAPAAEQLAGAVPSRGPALLASRGCGGCHRFSGSDALKESPSAERAAKSDAVLLAPDLRHVRTRMDAAELVRWLREPQSLKADTLMPATGLDETEARDLAAYLLTTPLAPEPPRPAAQRLPPLDRPVSFAEVDEQVLRVTCRHCHGNPDAALGDGGPGNSGGFGFPARHLDLSSYRGVASGFVDARGERRSLFEPSVGGAPFLVAALLARKEEEAGRARAELRGMPLGLPSLTLEQIQLVDTWIAQGRPQ
jgi:cytochrome c1